MRCFARRGAAVLALAALVLLPAAAAAQVAVPLADTVAAAIAGRWGVDAARIVVEPVRGTAWPDAARDVQLRGAGADGTWVVAYAGENGQESVIVRAGVRAALPVATHDLPRGTALEPHDMARREVVRWGPPAAEATPVEAGWVTRRRVIAGEVLDGAAVGPPLAVRPGQDVRVIWTNGVVSVTLPDRAAGRAAVGERVYVRAITGRRLEGVAIAYGLVRVGPRGGDL